jgi:hypothetical protein
MDTGLPLERLRRDLSLAEAEENPEPCARLALVHSAVGVLVDFFGSPFDEPYFKLCRNLVLPSVAPCLASLSLRSPDEGANGTCNWDLSYLAESDATFPSLKHLSVRQNAPGDHNRVIIAADYDEAGSIAAVLRKAPALDTLVVPSAPDKSFFAPHGHPLRYLSVDAGYDTQAFIANLAASGGFPNLKSFEFGEFNETYLEDFSARCTPFTDYRRLFTSATFHPVRNFVWRNPVASAGEIAELRALRPRVGLQFKIVRFSSMYVDAPGAA